MRLQILFLVAVVIFMTGSNGFPTGAATNQATLSTVTAHDTRSLSQSDSTNKLRGAGDAVENEERGIFTTAKFMLWLKRGVDPEEAYKRLHLPRTYDYAPDHKNWKKMQKFYEMWLNKMAAKKPPTT
ncbi:hypothetical protein F441_21870 [Phytophthora nicotianae CJ01A1]|uniref:RxLR effector protein n=7 Tax=Phytophthora nicotianae TaxID=4792 RepID=W2PHQ2_PHYN3|nr:hypothetical protein PPTG_18813 [Phytophthora nicotianae INRA-310]ETK71361.1 hypothetical protein L915_21382 [Phytophthora nicotianae]ETP00778.1 hypothetical protein F441_21870 [Phytophthora nicotianae CJ01A1]ETL24803.1 hypothetical protein L916_21251 [Phytophthora nicotianae]ETL78019.1 hypothetical protein L917_21100 [Phytophthora nicotianae]ETM99539.1 hypothetical protein PPTG_18813 [Phytophthora nicotianae INRA-310]